MWIVHSKYVRIEVEEARLLLDAAQRGIEDAERVRQQVVQDQRLERLVGQGEAAPERVDGPALVADLSFASTDLGAAAFDANAPPPVGSREAVPGDARPGQAGLGHHLRR